MTRRSNVILVMLATLGMSSFALAADEVATYLERLELRRLLATHLEDELADLERDAAEDVIVQLVGLYTTLLENVEDGKTRVELEARGRRLLERAPAERADALRLALLRGRSQSIETIAEEYRLRRASDADVQRAIMLADELMPELEPIRVRLNGLVDDLERRSARSSSRTAEILDEELDRVRRLKNQVTFVQAWTLYYHAYLTGDTTSAQRAIDRFGSLLQPDDEFPSPSDVSVDLRENEAFARSILGMALSQSIANGRNSAHAWLDLLEVPRTAPPIREQLHAWRTVVDLEHNDYRAALNTLEAFMADNPEPEPAWLRLLAVHALDSEDDTYGRSLAQVAIAHLASHGELGMVLDLAGRYGVESLGENGFASLYVRGVIAYNETRIAHDDELPTLDDDLVDGYQRAARFFADAPDADDADRFPDAVAMCRSLEAWCRYFQGRYREARELFETASEMPNADRAAESLWMAIVCLDKLARQSENNHMQADLLVLIERFLERFPSSTYAPRLILRRTATIETPSLDDVDALLAIPPQSDVYRDARRRAAQILFAVYRRASPPERIDVGTRFLAAAQGLMLVYEQDVLRGDPGAREQYITWARQVLDVALSPDMQRLGAARTALETLEVFADDGHLDLAEYEQEIAYQAVRERLLSDAIGAADRLANELWTSEPGGEWAVRAARVVFFDAYARYDAAAAQGRTDEVATELVIRHGPRALSEYADDDAGLEEPGVLAWHAALADVMLERFLRTGDDALGGRTRARYERLIGIIPTDAGFIRAIALLAGELNDRDAALDAWRRLLAGLPAGSDRWFEARYESLALLARLDPDRATQVLAQHRQLHPDYGPAPWGPRLRMLGERLHGGGGSGEAER